MAEINEVLSGIVEQDSIVVPRHALVLFYEGVLKVAGFGLGGMLVMAGKKAGVTLAEQFRKELGRDITVEEAIEVISKLFELTKTGSDMKISIDNNQIKLSMKNSFLAKDLSNKKPVCKPLSGFIMGFFGSITGKNVKVSETHCIAQGEQECLFEGKIS